VWEIFEYGQVPYPGMTNTETYQQILVGYRMPCPTICPTKLYHLVLRCWNIVPSYRPSFKEIHQNLKQSMDEQKSLMNSIETRPKAITASPRPGSSSKLPLPFRIADRKNSSEGIYHDGLGSFQSSSSANSSSPVSRNQRGFSAYIPEEQKKSDFYTIDVAEMKKQKDDKQNNEFYK